jgi:aldehyde dehydrogenase (NAD(P)+)
VQRGFLEFVYGGADVGSYCCHHALVAAVHLTGSEATYNNIMFGSPKVRHGVLSRPKVKQHG